jgi:hypothetical protein
MREIVHHGFQLDRRQEVCTQAAGSCTESEGFGKYIHTAVSKKLGYGPGWKGWD